MYKAVLSLSLLIFLIVLQGGTEAQAPSSRKSILKPPHMTYLAHTQHYNKFNDYVQEVY